MPLRRIYRAAPPFRTQAMFIVRETPNPQPLLLIFTVRAQAATPIQLRAAQAAVQQAHRLQPQQAVIAPTQDSRVTTIQAAIQQPQAITQARPNQPITLRAAQARRAEIIPLRRLRQSRLHVGTAGETAIHSSKTTNADFQSP